jgi:hypothetical protein
MTHAATTEVENSAQGSSCKLKFVHDVIHSIIMITRQFCKHFTRVYYGRGKISKHRHIWTLYCTLSYDSKLTGDSLLKISAYEFFQNT